MKPNDEPHGTATGYTIGELAELGGVSRRTVRYYVQRGLLQSPVGAGRGSHYTQQHLDTLIRIRRLQEAGRPLESITEDLGRPALATPSRPSPEVRYSAWTRITIADGIELHLRDVRLETGQVRELGDAVRRMIGRGEES